MDKSRTAGLASPGAMILSGDTEYYGGDQAWFGERVREAKKGCSIAAAANIFMYLALTGEKYRPLYRGAPDKADFTAHMNAVSEYLSPGAFGLWSAERFIRGGKAFAASRGVALEASAIRRFDAEKAADFIGKALADNKPAAMLIGLNRRMKPVSCFRMDGRKNDESFVAHWVTVTELSEGKVKVSSWGKYAYVSLDDYAGNEMFRKALLYFY